MWVCLTLKLESEKFFKCWFNNFKSSMNGICDFILFNWYKNTLYSLFRGKIFIKNLYNI